MAKFKIRQKTEDTLVTEFFLKEADGSILLKANSKNYDWGILTINKEGKLRLASGISEDIGLSVGSSGKINLV